MHYKATIPFNPTLPYEASISDNGVTTCWISTSYEEHKALEIAVKQEKSGELKSKGKEKRSNGVHMRLTERKGLGFGKDGKGSGAKGMHLIDKEEQLERSKRFGGKKGVDVPKNEKEAGFLPWEFECLQGYKAHANVGARMVTYVAHGQEFYFIPKEKEDVQSEEWVYDLKLWCGKPGKNGLIQP
ncbi:hypothetical protein EG329_005314 [Mollisiaceae sp. DMI_Dod_QoI]|nr:hypothetical protein EG329_005314 [Helotiales sp. DMI_Dod_QoI]